MQHVCCRACEAASGDASGTHRGSASADAAFPRPQATSGAPEKVLGACVKRCCTAPAANTSTATAALHTEARAAYLPDLRQPCTSVATACEAHTATAPAAAKAVHLTGKDKSCAERQVQSRAIAQNNSVSEQRKIDQRDTFDGDERTIAADQIQSCSQLQRCTQADDRCIGIAQGADTPASADKATTGQAASWRETHQVHDPCTVEDAEHHAGVAKAQSTRGDLPCAFARAQATVKDNLIDPTVAPEAAPTSAHSGDVPSATCTWQTLREAALQHAQQCTLPDAARALLQPGARGPVLEQHDMQSDDKHQNQASKQGAQACQSLLQRLNQQQLAAVLCNIDTPLLVAAGPGSGKTTAMIARVAFLMYQVTFHQLLPVLDCVMHTTARRHLLVTWLPTLLRCSWWIALSNKHTVSYSLVCRA